MRLPSPVAIVVFVIMVGLVGPAEAKPGKGGGGGARAHSGHGGGGGGHKHQASGGKHSGKDSVASAKPDKEKPLKEKPAKEKFAHEKPVKEKPAKDKFARHDKPAKDKASKDRGDDDDQGEDHDADDDREGDETGDDDGDDADEPAPYNKKQKQLANFQRQRDKKLAQAEHLRQIAERNGNPNLLANADRMEAQAYEQYSRKVSHLEKFGVTDPLLDLDGDGFADPWRPQVDPLDDPLADPMLDDPLGSLESIPRLRR
jgi:hypothetical protein